MNRTDGITFILVGFITGVTLSSFFSWAVVLFIISLMTASALAWLLSQLHYGQRKNKQQLISPGLPLSIIAVTLSLVFGFWWTERSLISTAPPPTGEITARVVSEAIIRPNNTQYRVRNEDLNTDILVTTERGLTLKYGDLILIEGEITEPPIFSEFNYQKFLAKEGIGFVSYYPQVSVVDHRPHLFYSKLFTVKDRVRDRLRRFIPYPNNTVISAMILGDGQLVPTSVSDSFSQTGIRHITAISGMHISIIMSLILILLTAIFKIPLRYSIGLTILILIVYVAFVGSPASAVRAIIMGSLSLMAIFSGRSYIASRSLLAAGSVMLIFNPLLLRWDIGFQLSFLAVSGIILISPLVWNQLKLLTPNLSGRQGFTGSLMNGLYGLLSVTIGAHLATLPLVVYHFGHLSIVAPLTNLLVMPIIPALLVAGFIFILTSLVFPPLSALTALPVYLISQYVIWVSFQTSNLPAAHFHFDQIGWPTLLMIYLILMILLIAIYSRPTYRSILNKKMI